MKVILYKNLKDRRAKRIRSKIHGTKESPRLSVFRSNKFVYVQAIDDLNGCTLAAVFGAKKGSAEVGKKLGLLLKEKKILSGIFDRGSYRYHGVVKKLAEGIREAGIKF